MLVTGVGTEYYWASPAYDRQTATSCFPTTEIQDHIMDYGCNKIDSKDGMLREFVSRPRFLCSP